jgi:diguanylate cyclase (GGDEF)-like protein/PAS domain S-box-containing protein
VRWDTEEYFRRSFTNAAIGMAIAAPNGRYLQVNPALCRLLGYGEEELLQLSFQAVTHPDDVEITLAQSQALLAGDISSYQIEKRYVRRDGRVIWAQVTSSLERDAEGKALYFIAQVQDISDRKRLEHELHQREQIYRLLARHIPNTAVFLFDRDLRYLAVEGQSLAAHGYRGEELEGKTIWDVLPRKRADTLARLYREALAGRSITVEHEVGERIYLVQILPVTMDEPEEEVMVGLLVSQDITDRKLVEQALQQKAHHDTLTGLPNRDLFHDRLLQALAFAQRGESCVGLLFVDLDGFKSINDRAGHDTGDRVLQQVARILGDVVRASDTVARWGGDEFLIILPTVGSAQNAVAVAQKVIGAINTDVRIDCASLEVHASVGISLYPADASTPDGLIRCADEAMYRAKQRGKNTWECYALQALE